MTPKSGNVKHEERSKRVSVGFREPAGRHWKGKGWPRTWFLKWENEGFLKPYENDARKTKKSHKKVWVCVVDIMAPQNDFKTVILEAPTQSESVFY